MGFPADFGFFFPLAFSRCSRCFSFARVVSPLAALRTSTSRSGAARARTWCSTKLAYSGLSWCRLMTCAMMASERATKSSLDLGVDFRILSRSASDEPRRNRGQTLSYHRSVGVRTSSTHAPLTVADPKSSVALRRSDSSSRSFSSRAFARGSRTASSSYSTSPSPEASRAWRAASFSASFCLRDPFFF
jgi:hypothetical protein